MIINGKELLVQSPIKDMQPRKVISQGMTYGLGEAGYDIRIKQSIEFVGGYILVNDGYYDVGKFCLASAIEEFDMPNDLVGIVHDKSSWARKGLSVFNTVIESGWKGFLTLELVYHGNGSLYIPAGSPIAQVVFHKTACKSSYNGRYQNQGDEPTPAKEAREVEKFEEENKECICVEPYLRCDAHDNEQNCC